MKKTEILSSVAGIELRPDIEWIKNKYENALYAPHPISLKKFTYVSLKIERISLLNFFIRRTRQIVSPDENFRKIIKKEIESSIKNDEFLVIRIYDEHRFRKNLFYDYQKNDMVSGTDILKEGRAIILPQSESRALTDNGYNYLYSIKASIKAVYSKNKKNKEDEIEKNNELHISGFSLRGFFSKVNHMNIIGSSGPSSPNNFIVSGYQLFCTKYVDSKVLSVKYLFRQECSGTKEKDYIFPVFVCEHGQVVGNRMFFDKITRRDYKKSKKMRMAQCPYSIIEQSVDDSY